MKLNRVFSLLDTIHCHHKNQESTNKRLCLFPKKKTCSSIWKMINQYSMLFQKFDSPLDKNVLVNLRTERRRNNRSVIDLTYLLIPSGSIYYLGRTGLEIVRHHKCRPCLRELRRVRRLCLTWNKGNESAIRSLIKSTA